MSITRFISPMLGALTLCLLPLTSHAAKGKPAVPDLTQGGQKDEHHDWTLGPTGARGWIWGWHSHTTDARQILITDVAAGSPADGILAKGDVITGVDGQPFRDDARIVYARAISAAERSGGVLRLERWRSGNTAAVEIKIPVRGAYAATAPYQCAKSKRIFEEGCAAIAKKGFKDARGGFVISIANDLNALALVASGKPEYLSIAAEYARAVAASTPGGHIAWGYGYETLFLAEYAAATKDASVLPGLTRLATDIAEGQSGVGTWGHSFARPNDRILNGYGCMNQPGIVLTLAMIAAREAGVKSPTLDAAIAKSARFLRWYSGKGGIPYGDHAPWTGHEDNGKCSSGAIMFDLLGEKEPARFFSRMALAAYEERESGHTGNFFNMLWALPGVGRNGPLATGAYMEQTGWYYDLARKWDGSFQHQGIPAERESYDRWDSTGAYLLSYALPLKSLFITGKKPSVVPELTANEVAQTIADGKWNFWDGQERIYDTKPTKALYAGITSWSPIVRERSAKALGKKPDVDVAYVVRLLDAPVRETRYGASIALAYLGEKADVAFPKLRPLLASEDPWQRVHAAEAIVEMSEPLRNQAIPDLLKVIIRKGDAEDPRRCVLGPISEVLFTPSPGSRGPDSILRKSFAPVAVTDRPLLMAAIREVLKSEDGRIRGGAGSTYGKLTTSEIALLLPDIIEAIRTPAPSGEMFAYDVRMTGLELLAKHRIREGMALCVDIMMEWRWGRDLNRAIRALAPYQGSARGELPRLREVQSALQAKIEASRNPDQKNVRDLAALEKLIAEIEADASPKPVVTAAEFVAQASTASPTQR